MQKDPILSLNIQKLQASSAGSWRAYKAIHGVPTSPPDSPPLWPTQDSKLSAHTEAILRSQQELNKFYAQIPEGEYDLSLRDLVDQTAVLAGGALPVEKAKYTDNHGSGETNLDSKSKSFDKKWHFPSLISSKKGTPKNSAPASPRRVEGRRSSSSVKPSPQRPSPKHSPRSSPRSSPYSSITLGALDLIGHQSMLPARVFPDSRVPAAKIDHSNRCAVCASHIVFFKVRCLVCERFYCKKCVKMALSENHVCVKTCHGRPTSKRYARRMVYGCLPFGFGKQIEEDDDQRSGTGTV